MGDHRIFFWLESYNSAAKYVADLHVWGGGVLCCYLSLRDEVWMVTDVYSFHRDMQPIKL